MQFTLTKHRSFLFGFGSGQNHAQIYIYIDTSNDSKHDLWEHGLRRRRRSLRISGAVTCLDVQEHTELIVRVTNCGTLYYQGSLLVTRMASSQKACHVLGSSESLRCCARARARKEPEHVVEAKLSCEEPGGGGHKGSVQPRHANALLGEALEALREREGQLEHYKA